MPDFTANELTYLREGKRLARLATADTRGLPQVTPVGMWFHNEELNTIDIGGRDLVTTKKYRNVVNNPQASIVIDDLASTDPWRPRAVMVQGRAEALANGSRDGGPVIRLTPDKVVSWGLDD